MASRVSDLGAKGGALAIQLRQPALRCHLFEGFFERIEEMIECFEACPDLLETQPELVKQLLPGSRGNGR